MDDLQIVDPHMHLWDLERNYYPWLCDEPMIRFRFPDYRPLRRTYLPDDYRRDCAGHAVVRTVHIDAEWDPADPVGESRWLMEVQDRYGLPHGIVGAAWPARGDIAEVLAGHCQFPGVSGVRNRPPAARSPQQVVRGAPGSMDDPDFRAGIALLGKYDLSFDLITPYWHLAEACDLARDFPDLQIIVNHAGALANQVFETEDGYRGWHLAMEALAEHANVAVKISGLWVAGRPWVADDYRRVVLETIRLFGVERCMFASNFPVDSLVAEFDAIYSGFKTIVAALPEADRRKLFHDNAVRIYRLAP